MFSRALLVAGLCAVFSGGAMAADMRVVSGGEGVTYITVQGDFEIGDDVEAGVFRFRSASANDILVDNAAPGQMS
jgi:hypothetical protein